MVSAGTVTSNAQELMQEASNYMTQVEGLSSSWAGKSHDSLLNHCSEFNSEIKQVSEQLNAFAEAVTLLEQYKNEKKNYEIAVNNYNTAASNNDAGNANTFKNDADTITNNLNSIGNNINTLLQQASSFKLDAQAIQSSVAPTTTDSSGNSTDGTSAQTLGSGGQFVPDDRDHVYGKINSSLDGKDHTIYRQSRIDGWSQDCNRAAAASIASAFDRYDGESVDIAKKSSNGIGYNSNVTNKYFSNFGLSANVRDINGSYDTIKNDMVSNLSRGNYVMFDLSQPHVVGASGQEWTSTRHWVSVLDIKRTGSGENDYAIFVSDSGHGASAADHGLGAGWYNINEFSGQKIAHYTTVSNNQVAV